MQQRVNEKPVTARRRHSPGRGVRGAQIAQFLQIRHDVANGSRTQVQSGVARQRARADGLAIADVTLNQGPQQMLGAFVESRMARQGGFRTVHRAH